MSAPNNKLFTKLENARRWLELFNEELDSPYTNEPQPSVVDEVLVRFTKIYVTELEHCGGLSAPYESDFARYAILTRAAREVNVVFDSFREISGAEEKMPGEVQALVAWLFSCVFDLTMSNRALEGLNPDFPIMLATYKAHSTQ